MGKRRAVKESVDGYVTCCWLSSWPTFKSQFFVLLLTTSRLSTDVSAALEDKGFCLYNPFWDLGNDFLESYVLVVSQTTFIASFSLPSSSSILSSLGGQEKRGRDSKRVVKE
jgi:hypothetical protein